MNNKIKIISAVLVLLLILGGYYWYTRLNAPKPVEQIRADQGNFNIQANLPEGWSRSLTSTENKPDYQSDTVNFSNGKARVEVKTVVLQASNKGVFTGYDPTMVRERKGFQWEYKSKYFRDKKEGIQLVRFMETVNPTTYYIVDGNSFEREGGKDTFTYELPLLVKRDGKTTKTSIIYFLDSGLNDEETAKILDEADQIMLSLKAG